MHHITIYVDIIAGRYEAMYWHTDERRYMRFVDYNELAAIQAAAKDAGYAVKDCKIIQSY